MLLNNEQKRRYLAWFEETYIIDYLKSIFRLDWKITKRDADCYYLVVGDGYYDDELTEQGFYEIRG